MREEWTNFAGGKWESDIDVRDFIQKNYEPYDGVLLIIRGPGIEEEIFLQLGYLIVWNDDEYLVGLMRYPQLIAFFLNSFCQLYSQSVFVAGQLIV